MLTVYGIASCESCREARRWLDARKREYRFHDLRRDGIDAALLERWCARVDWRELVNVRSVTWRRIPDADRGGLNAARAVALMLEYPTLVKRPLLEYGDNVLVGFAPDEWKALLTD